MSEVLIDPSLIGRVVLFRTTEGVPARAGLVVSGRIRAVWVGPDPLFLIEDEEGALFTTPVSRCRIVPEG